MKKLPGSLKDYTVVIEEKMRKVKARTSTEATKKVGIRVYRGTGKPGRPRKYWDE